MKKHRKLLALLVALTFLFSIAAPVMAAPSAGEEKAAGTLNALGIIEGYPDGSFGLDRDITRAEFAKIAVVAAGLGEAEGLMKNTPSKFSDVATGEWYTGWVNLASAQGYIKGDPAGTFRPDAKITYAEVLTVLLRLVGYNDNLPGDWPMNYLTKAVQEGVTKGVSFDASSPAVRGSVFMLTEATLNVPMVNWSNDKEAFGKVDPETKLIANSFKGTMEEGLVTDINWDKNGDVLLAVDGVDYPVIDNVVIAGAANVIGLLGSRVDFVVNEDEELVYAAAKVTNVVSATKATFTDKVGATPGKVKISSKDYSFGDDVEVTLFPGTVEITSGVEIEADNIVVVLDKKGNAEWAFVYNYGTPSVVEEVSGGTAYLQGSSNISSDAKKVQVFIKNDEIVRFSDLAEGDLLYSLTNVKGADNIVFASDEVLTGELQKANAAGNKLTIGGTQYDINGDALVSVDGGKNFDKDRDDIAKEMFDNDVDFMLSPFGKIALLASSVEAEELLYGVVNTYVPAAGLTPGKVAITTASGKQVIYEVAKNVKGDPIVEETLVEYSLNDDGILVNSKTKGLGTLSDSRTDRAEIGTWYRVADNAVFFALNSDGDAIKIGWDSFRNAEGVDDPDAIAYVLKNGALVAAFYASEVSATGDSIAILAGISQTSKGYVYDFFLEGERVSYTTVDADAVTVTSGVYAGTASGYKLTLSGDKLASIARVMPTKGVTVPTNSGASRVPTWLTVDRVNGNQIVLSDNSYFYTTEDTVVLNGLNPAGAPLVPTVMQGSKVSRHDEVVIWANDFNEILVILVKMPVG